MSLLQKSRYSEKRPRESEHRRNIYSIGNITASKSPGISVSNKITDTLRQFSLRSNIAKGDDDSEEEEEGLVFRHNLPPIFATAVNKKRRSAVTYAMWICNTILACAGSVLTIVGLKMQLGKTYWNTVIATDNYMYYAINIATLLGVVFIFAAFCGVWGMEMSSAGLLTVYFVMLLVLLIANIVAVFTYFNEYPAKRMQTLKSIEHFGQISERGQRITDAWAAGQRLFNCCGLSDIDDFLVQNVTIPPPPCSTKSMIQGCESAFLPYARAFAAFAILLSMVETVLLGCTATMLHKPHKNVEEVSDDEYSTESIQDFEDEEQKPVGSSKNKTEVAKKQTSKNYSTSKNQPEATYETQSDVYVYQDALHDVTSAVSRNSKKRVSHRTAEKRQQGAHGAKSNLPAPSESSRKVVKDKTSETKQNQTHSASNLLETSHRVSKKHASRKYQ